jgi:UDPglucose 6-dehydrogenase
LIYIDTKKSTFKNVDALVIVTEWQHYRAPDFEFVKQSLKQPVIFDGRYQLEPELLSKQGITNYSIGRKL